MRAVIGGQAAAGVGVDAVATRAVVLTRIALALVQLGREATRLVLSCVVTESYASVVLTRVVVVLVCKLW